MTALLRRVALLAVLAVSVGGCVVEDGTGIDDGESGTPTGGSSTGPYWSRNDGQRTAYLYLSGSTAKACAGGVETIGTFNSSKPSMTYIIQGNRIEFPLEFRNDALLVGVPDQAINTNTATWYVRSNTYTCSGGGGGGTGGGGGGGGGSQATTGRITFYTSRADGGSTTIRLAGQTIGSLNSYFPNGAPDCRQTQGTVSVERSPGTYSFTAEDQEGRTWSGNVTSVAGGCFLMHLR